MSGADLGFAAPAALRSRVEAAISVPVARASQPSRRFLLQGFAFGTALSAAAAASVVFFVARSDQDERLLGDVVSAHQRSLRAEHLTDVRSADQQIVRPWFSGKLAVVPPVIDLAAQGFTLVGGRLDTSTASRWPRLSIAVAFTLSICSWQRPRARVTRRHVVRLCKASTHSAGAIRACASLRSAIWAMTSCATSISNSKRACAPGREFQTGVVNRVVPSRSMRGRRSTSQDKYSFMASVVFPGRS